MGSARRSKAASKYVHVSDTRILGRSANAESGTGASGIKYDNAYWVLREVWGV